MGAILSRKRRGGRGRQMDLGSEEGAHSDTGVVAADPFLDGMPSEPRNEWEYPHAVDHSSSAVARSSPAAAYSRAGNPDEDVDIPPVSHQPPQRIMAVLSASRSLAIVEEYRIPQEPPPPYEQISAHDAHSTAHLSALDWDRPPPLSSGREWLQVMRSTTEQPPAATLGAPIGHNLSAHRETPPGLHYAPPARSDGPAHSPSLGRVRPLPPLPSLGADLPPYVHEQPSGNNSLRSPLDLHANGVRLLPDASHILGRRDQTENETVGGPIPEVRFGFNAGGQLLTNFPSLLSTSSLSSILHCPVFCNSMK
ncbi:unnamed protein product [Peniophora sp. CBMAI 1063]|nr:unnamed protein product [Peniophora sp. CBMAI 1063]